MDDEIDKSADIIRFDRAYSRKCRHGPYIINEEMHEVVCEKCEERVNPVWVLTQLMNKKSQYNNAIFTLNEKYKKIIELTEKAKDKARCKCRYCKKMTPIIRLDSVKWESEETR